jgi:site-specific DNA-methyltransferase (adenine-specific)
VSTPGRAGPRRATATSSFGVGRRESHDSSGFYARFSPPELSDDDTVVPPEAVELDDAFIVGDARDMHHLPSGSVALVVTSPPYFVGKEYELDVARHEIPTSYVEYLHMLEEVFAECVRVLEPGGRIAVNVANLGRKPYRSLSADVIGILQDRLGLLLRGEVIWQKAEGSTGSCAWGTFRSPANPVLRDVTERVIIASKGRFDRARSPRDRELAGLPHRATVTADEFMEATLDVWRIEAESAKRVGHPAPFPVELPERLIHLYTYEGDLVLDPFMGSGSTLVAAARTGRRFVGYDLDPTYVAIARRRVAQARTPSPRPGPAPTRAGVRHDHRSSTDADEDFPAGAVREGRRAQELAERLLLRAGFEIVARNRRLRAAGLTVNFVARDRSGGEWLVDVSGAFTTARPGLLRSDTLWKTLGRAHVIRNLGVGRLLILTTNLPRRGSEHDMALRSAGPEAFFDAIEMSSTHDFERLEKYAMGNEARPLPGFWNSGELARLRPDAPDGDDAC